jgi:hypothetical protein
MAGPTWSIQVDGNEINPDAGPYRTTIPQLDWVFEMDLLLVQRDGDYPLAVRLQPREGAYDIFVQMLGGTSEEYQTRLAQLKAWLSPGFHTFTVQVRGMSAPKSFRACVVSGAGEYVQRRYTARAIAPVPVLA